MGSNKLPIEIDQYFEWFIVIKRGEKDWFGNYIWSLFSKERSWENGPNTRQISVQIGVQISVQTHMNKAH